MDVSSDRVECWASLAQLASQIFKLQQLVKMNDNDQFQFQYDQNIVSMKRLKINSKLKGNQGGFYRTVKNYQYNETLKWRAKSTAAQVIILPVSPHDENTTSGAAKVILSLLVLYGILDSSEANKNSEDPNLRKLRLSPNAQERYLLMVGDSLTQMRAKRFSELIDETSTSYCPRHKVTQMLQKAMDQVIFIPGDLHGGGFHIMQVVYNLFYGALIQKAQALLKWKRICRSDVSKCYQQAASLMSMLATEVAQQLFTEYVKVMHQSEAGRREFHQICDCEEFAVHLAKEYSSWLVECRELTTDEVF